eukprot:COSAG01_NODE_1446_length_10280_cov_51.403791_7_plen_115_part_00
MQLGHVDAEIVEADAAVAVGVEPLEQGIKLGNSKAQAGEHYPVPRDELLLVELAVGVAVNCRVPRVPPAQPRRQSRCRVHSVVAAAWTGSARAVAPGSCSPSSKAGHSFKKKFM